MQFKAKHVREVALQAARRKAALKAQEVRNQAVLHCPVDTGRLRQSIGVRRLDEDTWRVGTNVVYAPFVEFGTRFQAPAAFFRKALAAVRT